MPRQTRKQTNRTYKSDLTASVHEAVVGLAKIGVIGKRTMRKFDALCLVPVGQGARDRRAVRARKS